jgi:hypothetical protein
MEEDFELNGEVDDSPIYLYYPYPDYDPYGLSEGQALHSPADPTLD